MQAVILAAGKGLRLRPFTEKHPKPLIHIGNKPLLEHTLAALPEKITKVFIVVGYLGEQIVVHFGSYWNSRQIHYVKQTELLGTGDALFRAKEFLVSPFLVVNGDDIYTKADLTELTNTPNSMLVWPSQKPSRYGIIQDEKGNFDGFSSESSLINCGAYFLTSEFFNTPLVSVPVPNGVEYSLPHTLAEVAKTTPVKLVTATRWLPVGTPEQLQFANSYFIDK
ncbi:MAG TPA: sugar phosphate nucleotidyltransferase [Candidatus Doudnabacteria bacterium]|nr:sugar phosphate nucleotidyltransferase [Candidatus Doudnabacteria bacterium]